MKSFPLQMFTTVVASLAALCGIASPSSAQSTGSGDPYKTVVAATASSYWGYTYSPYAAIIHAKGDYLVKTQEASLMREKVRQTKLETRRLQLEHWEWERDFKSGALNRERERVHKAKVERARFLPQLTEILAAVPHNRILDELRKRPELPSAGSIAVQPEWLAHIHVTVDGRGNMGLLKNDRIFWPPLLVGPDFAETRDKIDRLLASAKEQALSPSNAQIDPALLNELRQRVAGCKKRIDAEMGSGGEDSAWNLRHYIEAKRFLKHVDDAIFVLEKPNAAMYLNPLRRATVAELVGHMKKEGIRFAPATVGCERFYIALQRALADEVTRLQEQEPTTKQP